MAAVDVQFVVPCTFRTTAGRSEDAAASLLRSTGALWWILLSTTVQ